MSQIIKAGGGGSFSGAHSDLTGVSSDQHHAASHTLASHSAKAHGDLTGIGATDHHSNATDHASTNDPTANQKAALAGTGTPSVTDKYINDSDARNTNSRAPNGSASGELGGSYPGPTVNATHSGSAHLALATNAVLLGTAAAAGAAGTTLRSNDTIAAFDATVPVTQASGDAAATGSVAFAARRDHKHGMPTIPAAASGGTPAVVLGTAAAAGVSATFLRDDDTILAFDATSPTTQAFADAAVVGVATVTARRDHKHAMPAHTTATSGHAQPATTVTDETTYGVAKVVGTAVTYSREDHDHGSPGLGTTASTAAAGNDSRLSDARTPAAHASSHTTGSDKVATGTPDGTKFLRDDFAWTVPTATPPVLVGPKNLVSTVEAIAANTYVHVGRNLEITSAGSIELAATSILEITP